MSSSIYDPQGKNATTPSQGKAESRPEKKGTRVCFVVCGVLGKKENPKENKNKKENKNTPICKGKQKETLSVVLRVNNPLMTYRTHHSRQKSKILVRGNLKGKPHA